MIREVVRSDRFIRGGAVVLLILLGFVVWGSIALALAKSNENEQFEQRDQESQEDRDALHEQVDILKENQTALLGQLRKLGATPDLSTQELEETGEDVIVIEGEEGPVGPRGAPGADGRNGRPGTDGTDGDDGADGDDSTVPGPTGPSCVEELGLEQCRGPKGDAGKDGAQGPAGPTCPEGTTLTTYTILTNEGLKALHVCAEP